MEKLNMSQGSSWEMSAVNATAGAIMIAVLGLLEKTGLVTRKLVKFSRDVSIHTREQTPVRAHRYVFYTITTKSRRGVRVDFFFRLTNYDGQDGFCIADGVEVRLNLGDGVTMPVDFHSWEASLEERKVVGTDESLDEVCRKIVERVVELEQS